MNDKLNELKAKQEEISNKISSLQVTNKKKDEETLEIRKLIAECRENLNRIKGLAPGSEIILQPCSQTEDLNIDLKDNDYLNNPNQSGAETKSQEPKDNESAYPTNDINSGKLNPVNDKNTANAIKPVYDVNTAKPVHDINTAKPVYDVNTAKPVYDVNTAKPVYDVNTAKPVYDVSTTNPVYDVSTANPVYDVSTVNPVFGPIGTKRYAEPLGKRDNKPTDAKKKGKCKDKISCRVDVNKMKLRVRGPSEDLKKLDAAQLINLLEKYQCQELILNTGEEIIKDPGEIRLVYCLHPGNIVMAAGIIMIAFLVNANLFTTKRSYRTKFMLNALYLSSFALHFGMVLWMIFIRGYALKFGLCQDTFHLVDNLILPKYFSVCVLLSALSLYSFLATHCATPYTSWSLEIVIQMIVVVVTFFLELITICYIVPALIKLRDATDDYMLDDEEPDCSVPDSYQRNLIKLGKLNWTICLTNFLTLVFLGANIYYITSKLNIGNN